MTPLIIGLEPRHAIRWHRRPRIWSAGEFAWGNARQGRRASRFKYGLQSLHRLRQNRAVCNPMASFFVHRVALLHRAVGARDLGAAEGLEQGAWHFGAAYQGLLPANVRAGTVTCHLSGGVGSARHARAFRAHPTRASGGRAAPVQERVRAEHPLGCSPG